MDKQAEIKWTDDAMNMLNLIPELSRNTAQMMVERNARKMGLSEINGDIMTFAREKILEILDIDTKSTGPSARDFLKWQIPRIMIQQTESPTYWIDTDSIMDKIHDSESWKKEWSEAGNKYEKIADEALQNGHSVTAKYAYMCSCNYYRWSHFVYNERNKFKVEKSNKSIEVFKKACKLYETPIEQIEIPFDGKSIPGYFQPAKNGNPAPCVIFVHGADSTKEEMVHNFKMIHERGFAVATFDGPGQAESALRDCFYTPDSYDQSISSFISYLQTRNDVNPDKIGLWGVCIGGHFVLRASALDKRVKACVCNEGGYSWYDIIDEIPPAWTDAIQYMSGYTDKEAFLKEIAPKLVLDNLLEHISCPTLFVHGLDDLFIPAEQVLRMYEETGGPKEVWFNPGGDHCSGNQHSVVWPKMHDWLVDRLGDNPKPIQSRGIDEIRAEIANIPTKLNPQPQVAEKGAIPSQPKPDSLSHSHDQIEQTVFKIWGRLLKIDSSEIDLNDHFMDIGGTSFSAQQMRFALEEELGFNMSEQLLTQCRTIKEVTEWIIKKYIS